eukprot:jgi/Hompol1/2139/HPOL_002084-RA
MEVLDVNCNLLSDYEVLSIINAATKARTSSAPSSKKNRQGQQQQQHNLSANEQDLCTVEYEVSKHLQSMPCAVQSPEIISAYIEAMKPWKLTRLEKLMILNLRPANATELSPLIEEAESRFSPEQMDEIMAILDQIVPLPALPDTANVAPMDVQ